MAAQLAFYINTAFSVYRFFLFIIISSTPLFGRVGALRFNRVFAQSNRDNRFRRSAPGDGEPYACGNHGRCVNLVDVKRGCNGVARAQQVFTTQKENRNVFVYPPSRHNFFALLILVTIILNFILLVAGSLIGNAMIRYLPQYYALWHILRFLVPFVLMIVLFASMYKVMPCVNLSFKQTLGGAFFSRRVCGLRFRRFFVLRQQFFSSYDIIYGSIAGIVVLFTWIFVTAYIILIGGEVNSFLAGHFSKRKREF
ncbi:MAG: YihY/virulence factor BrkB family protein [Clostridiales bacterium]|nr:MAG: YihY/virulence factor BrkB family protein [Clostridiales bacterium]